MNFRRSYALLPVVAVLLLAAAGEPKYQYLEGGGADFKSILAAPPVDGSAEQLAEIDQLLHWQAQRTPEEAQRCKTEETSDAFIFAGVLGKAFNAHDLPATAQLLENACADANAIVNTVKKDYDRKRPPAADARIHPCVTAQMSSSYPSGDATRGVVVATILAQIFPDQQKQLMDLGKQIGDDRALAGMHYPSDVAAGQKLGAAIAAKIIASSKFQADLEKARTECKTVH